MPYSIIVSILVLIAFIRFHMNPIRILTSLSVNIFPKTCPESYQSLEIDRSINRSMVSHWKNISHSYNSINIITVRLFPLTLVRNPPAQPNSYFNIYARKLWRINISSKQWCVNNMHNQKNIFFRLSFLLYVYLLLCIVFANRTHHSNET